MRPITDLSTLRKPPVADANNEAPEDVLIKFTSQPGSSNLLFEMVNADCTQLWSASRLLQIMGDSIFNAAQRPQQLEAETEGPVQ